MRVFIFFASLAILPAAWAQTVCPSTPIFSTCEITFELTGADATAHPTPYRDVELRVEFRRRARRTFAIPAFLGRRRHAARPLHAQRGRATGPAT